MNILQSIKDTKKSIRELKKTNPHLFPEYIAVLHAEADLRCAKQNLLDAKSRWKKVGN